MKFFVIIELILIAATVGISFADVPAVVLQVAIGACVVFGLIMLIFIGIKIYKELKGR